MTAHIGTKRDHRDLMCFLTTLREHLRMQNWDIIIMNEIADNEDTDVLAAVQFPRNHTCINLYIGSTFKNLSKQIKKSTLTHEMVHAQHRDVSLLWEDCVDGNGDISSVEKTQWSADFHTHMERFVSWIAMRLEEHAPAWDARGHTIGKGIYLEGDNR